MLVGKLKKTKAVRQVNQRSRATWTRRGNVLLKDEALTPDSSRFWPADRYAPGKAQPSFDKQFVRDYLERIGWNKQPPAPALPLDVVAGTREKYREAYQLITGQALD